MSACRSCGAPIEWCVTTKGRNMPLDPEPRDDGNLVKDGATLWRGGETVAIVRFVATDIEVMDDRYVSHFVTCPHAKEHRK